MNIFSNLKLASNPCRRTPMAIKAVLSMLAVVGVGDADKAAGSDPRTLDLIGDVSAINSETGHTYTVVAAPLGITWSSANQMAIATGGHLATITSQAENDFVFALIDDPQYWTCDVGVGSASIGPWLGGFQDSTAVEPDGGWHWVTCEPWGYTSWEVGQPNNNTEDSDYLHYFRALPCPTPGDKWNDNSDTVVGPNCPVAFVVEHEPRCDPLSAGHQYNVVQAPGGITWSSASAIASSMGGYLATITSQAENDFVFALIDDPQFWTCDVGVGSASIGPWLGGFQDSTAVEPDGGWQWVSCEPWGYTSWEVGQPNNNTEDSDYLHYFRALPCPTPGDKWNDNSDTVVGPNCPVAFVVEFNKTELVVGLGLDTDFDGIADYADSDLDGDGTPNASDPDVDGDGVLNEVDPDIDGDGVINGLDGDVDGDMISNFKDSDVDGDGIPNSIDLDIDGDGIPNASDPDIDGDGLVNSHPRENDIDGDGLLNNSPKEYDNDGDGKPNLFDFRPNGPLGSLSGALDQDLDGVAAYIDDDIDGDGIKNGQDPDVDGDGVPNSVDNDIDGDGLQNADDPDIDGDGISNRVDSDADGDGSLNSIDVDDDGDSVLDADDADADGDGRRDIQCF